MEREYQPELPFESNDNEVIQPVDKKGLSKHFAEAIKAAGEAKRLLYENQEPAGNQTKEFSSVEKHEIAGLAKEIVRRPELGRLLVERPMKRNDEHITYEYIATEIGEYFSKKGIRSSRSDKAELKGEKTQEAKSATKIINALADKGIAKYDVFLATKQEDIRKLNNLIRLISPAILEDGARWANIRIHTIPRLSRAQAEALSKTLSDEDNIQLLSEGHMKLARNAITTPNRLKQYAENTLSASVESNDGDYLMAVMMASRWFYGFEREFAYHQRIRLFEAKRYPSKLIEKGKDITVSNWNRKNHKIGQDITQLARDYSPRPGPEQDNSNPIVQRFSHQPELGVEMSDEQASELRQQVTEEAKRSAETYRNPDTSR